MLELNKIYCVDTRELFRDLPDDSIHYCVTSPPYWGLRDYQRDNQIGMEETPEAFIANMVEVFREVKRALRPDGTLWLNLGDTYSAGGLGHGSGKQTTNHGSCNGSHIEKARVAPVGYKRKELIGIPWRVALALQADGWYLRQDIIWHKPNPMPESVTDRCTKAHEYIFLMSKSERYFYDHEAIKECASRDWSSCGGSILNETEWHKGAYGENRKRYKPASDTKKRNKRSVWTVNTKPFKHAHFATFPPKLIEPCILAGCPKGGTVLDPFFGSGTTGFVAVENNRHYIGFELNSDYIEIAKRRIANAEPQLF
jgi:DNA modification methylase